MTRQEQWRKTPRALFQVATTENRDLHLAVLSLFAERELGNLDLTLQDLMTALPQQAPELRVDQDMLSASLKQLVEWGLLSESRNTSATYRTPEEFRRRNLQWSLTHDGQAAVAGLDAAVRFLDNAASLHSGAIDSIASSLARAVSLAADPASDPARICIELQQAEFHHESLRLNIRQFQSQLGDLLGNPTLSDAEMAEARDKIIEYLTDYIQEAELPAARVAEALRDLNALGRSYVLERALEGANLAPDLASSDPGPRWIQERNRRLDALEEWFLRTSDGSAPRMATLRSTGRDWVLQFLNALDLRRTHRRRSASIVDDFTALARAFAACGDDREASRLFVASFELHGARHHTLAYDDIDALDPATPAVNNPPIELTSVLRVHTGSRQRGQERPVADPKKQRARVAAEEAAKLRHMAEVRSAILTDGTVRLSTYARLEYEQFRDLLDLICAALTALPLPNGERRCISSDGQVEVIVHPADSERVCQLVTDAGTLTAPDFRLSIRLRGVDINGGAYGTQPAAAAGAKPGASP